MYIHQPKYDASWPILDVRKESIKTYRVGESDGQEHDSICLYNPSFQSINVTFDKDTSRRDKMYYPIVRLIQCHYCVSRKLAKAAFDEVSEDAAPTVGDVQAVFSSVVNRHRNLVDDDASLAVFSPEEQGGSP